MSTENQTSTEASKGNEETLEERIVRDPALSESLKVLFALLRYFAQEAIEVRIAPTSDGWDVNLKALPRS